MPTPVLVVGHRNPDNDSICSAVGYAHLKNELAKRDGKSDEVQYIPARLGQLPPESAWVLEENKVEAPEIISHVHTRVSDVMTPDPITIKQDASILEVGAALKKHNIRSLIVVDDDNKYMGLVGTRAIADRYMNATASLKDGDPSSTMAVASSLIDSLTQKASELMSTNVIILSEETLLKDAVDDLIASDLREGVVLDDDGHALGIVTRSDIAAAPRRQVVLVDHNEKRQAASGIDDAEVMEIIDHHRIADVATANPIQFINLPLGSTATIVTMEYRKYGVKIPKAIAKVLLSAILTDTVILKSPTATDIDREQVEYLAKIAGVDPVEFGIEIFKTRGGEDDMPVKDLVEADSKEFQLGDSTVLIAQHETVDLDAVLSREDEIRKHMKKLLEDHGYEFVLLMVTDIMAEGSQFLAEGNLKLINKAFGIECTGKGGTWMPGVLSRKKQVAAKLLA